MEWYKFKEGEIKGKLRVERAQVAWYDMERNGDCFDENWIVHKGDDVEMLQSIGKYLLTYIELDENADKCDKSRVFIHMDNGDEYELLAKKIDKGVRCSNFYDGRD